MTEPSGYRELPREAIILPRRYRPSRKHRYVARHPWRFVVEYGDGKRIKWEEGTWTGPAADVTRLEERVASGEWVPNAVPSSFPPEHVLSVPILIREIVGAWERVLEDKRREPPWFDDPPGRVY